MEHTLSGVVPAQSCPAKFESTYVSPLAGTLENVQPPFVGFPPHRLGRKHATFAERGFVIKANLASLGSKCQKLDAGPRIPIEIDSQSAYNSFIRYALVP